MKVLYISNGLTHYYNRVLSRLNREPGLELTVVSPANPSAYIGQGVHLTRAGADFPVIELPETRRFWMYSTFSGLARVLMRTKPDVVIVIESYLWTFLLDLPTIVAMKRLGARLILKTIPFRLLPFQDAERQIRDSADGFSRLPPAVNRLLHASGIAKGIKLLRLAMHKRALSRPDAHVNYVEAKALWATYGVNSEKIFVTGNSPDTDLLFSVKESLLNAAPLLPPNPRRLLHVGRLVEWKRVDMLIRVFARLRPRYPDMELVIVGDGPEEPGLKKLADERGLGTSVRFVGGVYDPRLLAQYYLAAGVYVLAGMGGLSINEAMCFGLPVLCSICDGTEKVLVREGINGRFFKDGDEEDFVLKLSWFLEHPELMREMGRKSEAIIRDEVNIHTVIRGYMDALDYVRRK